MDVLIMLSALLTTTPTAFTATLAEIFTGTLPRVTPAVTFISSDFTVAVVASVVAACFRNSNNHNHSPANKDCDIPVGYSYYWSHRFPPITVKGPTTPHPEAIKRWATNLRQPLKTRRRGGHAFACTIRIMNRMKGQPNF